MKPRQFQFSAPDIASCWRFQANRPSTGGLTGHSVSEASAVDGDPPLAAEIYGPPFLGVPGAGATGNGQFLQQWQFGGRKLTVSRLSDATTLQTGITGALGLARVRQRQRPWLY